MASFQDFFSYETFSSNYFYLVFCLIVLGALYLSDVWCHSTESCVEIIQIYGYQDENGPSTWPEKFPSARGNAQSPINLEREIVQIVRSDEVVSDLSFSMDLHQVPRNMRVSNNGHSIVVYACWDGDQKPKVSGGPLEEDYRFINLTLRWGPNDFEGSEHMIASMRYAMEMQAAFISESCATDNICIAARSQALLMISYLFMVTPCDNPYLEPIIDSLNHIKKGPMSYECIEPITLSLLMPDFSKEYFYYCGSLTFPPCTEGVKWIVKPEPLTVSSRQVNKFRRLCGAFGKIENNNRPVQAVNGRQVLYYK